MSILDDTMQQMVRIRKDTLENLKKIGKMGQSYNDVIDDLISSKLGD